MKIGDKVYCIKNVVKNIKNTTNILNEKNKIYKIIDIRNNFYRISSEINTEIIYSKYKNDILGFRYFNEYFISEKKLRKNKLNKLNKLN